MTIRPAYKVVYDGSQVVFADSANESADMSKANRSDREQLRPRTTAPRIAAVAESPTPPRDHRERRARTRFAIVRAQASDWRARSEGSAAFADAGEGMGV